VNARPGDGHARHDCEGADLRRWNRIGLRHVSGDSSLAAQSHRSVADGVGMYVGESIRTSLEEVRAHPLRSFFTLIGVILGSLALVVVLSVMDGVEAAVWQGMEDLGLDGVVIINQRKHADRVEAAKSHVSWGLG